MKLWLLCLWALCSTLSLAAQQPAASVKVYEQVFSTYPFSDPSPLPLLGRLYPYHRFDGYTDEAVDQSWQVVALENAYIKVLILPQIGGKIWSAQEKSTGRYFIYHNQVVKFRDVAMRGPWTSGGIEANYGIIGHTPNCATPVDFQTFTNPDGSVSCVIGTLDLLTRSTWRLEINLPADKAFFTTRSFWYNGTGQEQPYYHWMNAALPVKGNLEFVYPGSAQIGHNGEYGDWPFNRENGKFIRMYEQNDFGGYKSYHVFGTYAHFFGAYYHDHDFGTIRYSLRDEKAGKKLWIWGLSRQGMIWEDLLTDKDGQYWELQSGRLFNQNAEAGVYSPFKHRSFAPYATDVWTEYWYPMLKTGGAVEANEYGALHLKHEDGWLKIHFSPTQAISDSLLIAAGDGSRIYTQKLQLKPLQPFYDSVRCSVPGVDWQLSLGGHKLVYDFNEQAKIMQRPTAAPADFNWASPQGNTLLARAAMAQKLFPQAEEKLQAALAADPNHFDALVLMAQLMYRNMRYEQALQYARRALSIDTHEGAANYYYGLINAALGNYYDAKDGYDIASMSVAWRSAAYTGLSGLYLQEKNWDKAVYFADKALDFNVYNITALQYKAIAFRKKGLAARAEEVRQRIASMDKLSHFVNFERLLAEPTVGNMGLFMGGIRNELPQETYAELAVMYHGLGLQAEAVRLFEMSPPGFEANCWLHYLKGTPVDTASLDVRFAFPFRSETGHVLEALLAQSPHWKLRYALALVYADRNRMEECRQLLAACGDAPDVAVFYALRASLRPDEAGQLADLQRAVALDADWRYVRLLADWYSTRKRPAEALLLLADFYAQHPDHYIIGLAYAKALLQDKQYIAADTVMGRLKLIPFEGATESRDIYREIKLMQAVEQLVAGRHSAALGLVAAAREFPENLGVGSPYTEEIDFRLEDFLSHLSYEGLGQGQQAVEALSSIIRFRLRPGSNYETNYSEGNGLLTLWAYEALGRPEEGKAWLASEGTAALRELREQAAPDLSALPAGVSKRVLQALLDKGLLQF
jgi:predicted Zn-dependent protease